MKSELLKEKKETIDLSIIIVNWNTRKFLDECIESIYKTTKGINFEILVVDNDSSDDSVLMVKDKYPSVKLITNETNEGFAKANNKGIKKSRGDFILLLNPDTLLMGNPLENLFNFMKKNMDVGVCGCKVLNKDGSIEPACRRGIPTPKAALYRFMGLNKIFAKNPKFAKYNLTHLNPHKVSEVEAISGAFFMLRREIVYKTGLLDENFFLYGEEIDWCYRIKNEGYKIVYNPNGEVIHYKGASSSQNKIRSFYEFYRSMFVFHEKHFSPQSSLAVNIFVKVGIILRAISLFILKASKVFTKITSDLMMLTISFVLAFFLWHFAGLSEVQTIPELFRNIHFQSYINIWFIIAVIMVCSYAIFGMYEKSDFNQSREDLFSLTFQATSLGMVMIIVLNFMSRQFSMWSYPIPRSVFIIWWVLSILNVTVFRILFLSMRRRQKYIGRILLFGKNDEIGKIYDYFSELGSLKYHVVGSVSSGDKQEKGCPIIGNIDSIDNTIDEYYINEILIHNRDLNHSDLMKIITRTSGKVLSIRVIPDILDYLTGNLKVYRYAGIPTTLLSNKKPYHWYLSIKRALDIIISLFLLILAIPLYCVTAFYDRFVKQEKSTKKISVYGLSKSILNLKFSFSRHFEDLRLNFSSIFTPQILFHIFSGNLSFIGPHLYSQDKIETDLQRAALEKILALRPGVFNPASYMVTSFSNLGSLQNDLIYVNNISPLTDLKILSENVRKLFKN